MEKFYVVDTIGLRGGRVDSAITRIRSGLIRFRDLVLLLGSRGLPRGAKGRLHSACALNIMLYGSEPWPDKGCVRYIFASLFCMSKTEHL